MNEIEQRAERAQHWRGILDIFEVKRHWEWCAHIGLCETAAWTNRSKEHEMFRWSK